MGCLRYVASLNELYKSEIPKVYEFFWFIHRKVTNQEFVLFRMVSGVHEHRIVNVEVQLENLLRGHESFRRRCLCVEECRLFRKWVRKLNKHFKRGKAILILAMSLQSDGY